MCVHVYVHVHVHVYTRGRQECTNKREIHIHMYIYISLYVYLSIYLYIYTEEIECTYTRASRCTRENDDTCERERERATYRVPTWRQARRPWAPPQVLRSRTAQGQCRTAPARSAQVRCGVSDHILLHLSCVYVYKYMCVWIDGCREEGGKHVRVLVGILGTHERERERGERERERERERE